MNCSVFSGIRNAILCVGKWTCVLTALRAEAEEREPFAIDKMEAYSIYHEWIQESLKRQSGIGKKNAGAGPMVIWRIGRTGV